MISNNDRGKYEDNYRGEFLSSLRNLFSIIFANNFLLSFMTETDQVLNSNILIAHFLQPLISNSAIWYLWYIN